MHSVTRILSILLFSALSFAACRQQETTTEAQEIVDKSIEAHGGNAFEQAYLSFDFRDRGYVYKREGGIYEYRRVFTDSTEQNITDILNNNGFTRLINGDTTQLTAERRQAYTNSVNSVIYFALLPYRLNDQAVQKKYLGPETTIEGEAYHKLKVTFKQDGGGEDFEDEFIYWFHQDTHSLDYLAYSFKGKTVVATASAKLITHAQQEASAGRTTLIINLQP